MELEKFYKQVFFSCFRTSIYKKHDMEKQVKKWMPCLQQITENILKKNECSMEASEYKDVCNWWNSILKDILEGLAQNDTVLLEDAIEYGLKEFLECFISEEKLQQLRKESIDEQRSV